MPPPEPPASSADPASLPPVVRVVGPPGSGKTMLITSLQEALRREGVRTASAVSRGPGRTAIATSNGTRTTLERDVPLGYLAQVVSWIDPAVDLVLAEGYEEPGAPAIELRTGDTEDTEPHLVAEADLLATADPEAIAAAFAEHGPGHTAGLADLVLREILHRQPSSADRSEAVPGAQSDEAPTPGRLGRMLRRLRR